MDITYLAHLKARADVVLSQVSAATRRLQRSSWLERRRAQRVLDTVSEVAFILFVWSCPDATMAMAYVAAEEKRLQQHFPTLTRETLDERYLEAPVEVVGDIWRGVGGCSPARLAEAKRYYRDYGAYLRGSATTTKERPSRPLPKWSYAACGLWLLLKSLSPMQRSVWIVRGLRESGYNVGGIGGVCASGPSWRGRR